MASWSLLYVLDYLKQEGVSVGERSIAIHLWEKIFGSREREPMSDDVQTVLTALNDEYGVRTGMQERSSKQAAHSTFGIYLKEIPGEVRKRDFRKAWFRRGKSPEGD